MSPLPNRARSDDALEKRGVLRERVERKEAAVGMPQQSAIARNSAVDAIDVRDDLVGEEAQDVRTA